MILTMTRKRRTVRRLDDDQQDDLSPLATELDDLSPLATELDDLLHQLDQAAKHTLEKWLRVGELCDRFQRKAMNIAGTNKPVGMRYNKAYKQITTERISAEARTTRQHAIWLWTHKDAVMAWHANQPNRASLNHPTTLYRHYRRSEPKLGEASITRKPGGRRGIDEVEQTITRLADELEVARKSDAHYKAENAVLHDKVDGLTKENARWKARWRRLKGRTESQ